MEYLQLVYKYYIYIIKYNNENMMILNASKTNTMIVSETRTMQSSSLTIGGNQLKESDNHDILGVRIDCSWRDVLCALSCPFLCTVLPVLYSDGSAV